MKDINTLQKPCVSKYGRAGSCKLLEKVIHLGFSTAVSVPVVDQRDVLSLNEYSFRLRADITYVVFFFWT